MVRYGALLLATMVLGLCGVVFAQEIIETDDIAVFYNQESRLQQDMLIYGAWGNAPREDPMKAFEPKAISRRVYGLNVVTTGRYQGARFDFPKPLDITPLLAEKNVYLELYLAPMPGTVAPVAAPSMPDTAVTTPEDEIPLEMREGVEKVSTIPMPKLSNLRITLFTEKGQGQIVVTPNQFFPNEDIKGGWKRIDIPLNAIDPKLPVGGKLSRMLITSDAPAMFMLGRLAFVRDTKPLEITRVRAFPPFMEAGERLYFMADVKAGLARYEIVWDFNAAAGASIDATGNRVTYTYGAEGNYIITCTLRDLNGGKDLVSTALEVKISPSSR